MIFRYLAVLGEAPLAFVILVAAFSTSLLVGLVFHEVAHAYVADSLGDRTPRSFGRLSLNPKRHLDPVGSVLIFFVGFGWARPVPVNPLNTSGNVRLNMALIALAGPATNLVMAGIAGIPIRAGWVPFFHPFVAPSLADDWARVWTESGENLIGLFLGTIVLLNVILAIFNLVPLAPLDGFRVAVGILPRDLSIEFAKLEPWGIGILMVLIFLPFIGGPPLLFDAMGPPRDFFLELFAGDTQVRVV
jgi:Zn-dependent protease